MPVNLRTLTHLSLIIPGLLLAQTKNLQEKNAVSYAQNKGQVCDENFSPRHDILYSAFDGKLALHLKKSGLEYHLLDLSGINDAKSLIKRYRLDVNWKNCNPQARITASGALPGVTNYYLEQCGHGALAVKNFSSVEYSHLYDGINLRFYQHQGSFKYDYELRAGADYKKIILQYTGAEKLSINKQGDLLIKTPLGTVVEEAPKVIQGGVELPSKWVIHQNEASFSIEHLNPKAAFVIDPMARQWGTFYGAYADEFATSCTTDANGNVYIAGHSFSYTSTAIASVGAHQTSHGGQGGADAFVAKFNAAGVRQWATFYGGTGTEDLSSCAVDANGNVFLAGKTSLGSGTIIATMGAHQNTMAPGGTAGYLVKFDNAGVRQWGTYYGGLGNTQVNGCCVDITGNVYISGNTTASVAISTPGSHQPVLNGSSEGFIAKFNTNGVRQWGTYYGDTGSEGNMYCATDASANVFLCGSAFPGTLGAIASLNAAQPNSGGSFDPFVAKFDANGLRLWGTFCGGTGAEQVENCATDPSGNIFLVGETTPSSTLLVTSGAHQTTFGGNSGDGFLLKLNTNGLKQWGTYYGDNTLDHTNACATDAAGNVYITGVVTGNSIGTAIATVNGYSPQFLGGVSDAYLAKFNPGGVRQWGTYYGGLGNDNGMGCAVSASGDIYMCGASTSINYVATPGCHQFANGGLYDGFLVKFFECAVPSASNTTPPASLSVCYNKSTVISAAGTGTISWYTVPTLGNPIGTGNTYSTPVLFTNTVYYAENTNTCAPSGTRVAIPVVVNPQPNLFVNGISATVCKGTPVTVIVSGANSYTWIPSIYSGNSNVITPLNNVSFTITGSNGFGCTNTRAYTLFIHQLPVVKAQANRALICQGEEVILTGSGAQTYTWSTGNNTNPESQFPQITSIYTLTGTDNNNCTNTATVQVNVDLCEGLNENRIAGNELIIYPNPTKGILTLYNNSVNDKIEIFNTIGQRLLTKEITRGINKLDLSGIATGVYFIQYKGDKRMKSQVKLIID